MFYKMKNSKTHTGKWENRVPRYLRTRRKKGRQAGELTNVVEKVRSGPRVAEQMRASSF